MAKRYWRPDRITKNNDDWLKKDLRHEGQNSGKGSAGQWQVFTVVIGPVVATTVMVNVAFVSERWHHHRNAGRQIPEYTKALQFS